MAEVSLNVGGRAYDVTCRDGEEAHLRTLAALVDRKAKDAQHAVGGINEARHLLLAALLLADELVDARAGQPAAAPSPVDADANYPLMATALEQLADRVESVLVRLETRPASS